MNDLDGVAPSVRSILAAARDRAGEQTRCTVDARPLESALDTAAAEGRFPLIGEVKPTSPTTPTHHDHDPVTAAEAMVEGGAAAISVLTEPTAFGGSPEELSAVRDAVDVPVLRKDFLLTEAHLDTVAADVVLLIARFLDDLGAMISAAENRGFQPLVEVHTRSELDAALDAGATYIGINNRDLRELTVDLSTVDRLAPHVPADCVTIAESGVTEPADIRRFRAAGADAALVGSTIMAADDITARTRALVAA